MKLVGHENSYDLIGAKIFKCLAHIGIANPFFSFQAARPVKHTLLLLLL